MARKERTGHLPAGETDYLTSMGNVIFHDLPPAVKWMTMFQGPVMMKFIVATWLDPLGAAWMV